MDISGFSKSTQVHKAQGSANSSANSLVEVHQWQALPHPILDKIASHLQHDDTVAMEKTIPLPARSAVQAQVRRAHLSHRASQVSVLQQEEAHSGVHSFLMVLNDIERLPPRHQAEPLYQLGLRVRALPRNDRGEAFDCFIESYSKFTQERRSPQLLAMVDCARVSLKAKFDISTLNHFESVLEETKRLPTEHQFEPLLELGFQIHQLPQDDRSHASRMVEDATSSLLAKENYGRMASDTTELNNLIQLCKLVNPPAEVQTPEELTLFIDFFHLDSEHDHWQDLQLSAIQGHTMDCVLLGENVDEIAARYGIDMNSLAGLILRTVAASQGPAASEVQDGQNAVEVAMRYGVGTYGLPWQMLQDAALKGPARKAVLNGEDPLVVLPRFGIDLVSRTAECFHRLAAAGSEVRGGADPIEAAQRYSFFEENDVLLEDLQAIALQRQAVESMPPNQNEPAVGSKRQRPTG